MSNQTADYGTLFSKTWGQYKTRGLVIIGVVLISTVLILLLAAALGATAFFFGKPLLADIQSGQPAGVAMAAGGGVLFFTFLALFCMWGQAAVLAVSVDESLGVMAGLRAGWHYIWALGWVGLLVGGVIMLGFFLAVIPGIIFLVWFSFAMYVMVDEDKRGLDTLLASKSYVAGHWWDTFGKILVIWLLSMLVSVIPFLGQILTIIFTPFLILFLVNVYRNLKEIKSRSGVPGKQGSKVLWGTLAGLGLLSPIAGLVVVVVAMGPNLPTLLNQLPLGAGGAGFTSQATPHPMGQLPQGPTTTVDVIEIEAPPIPENGIFSESAMWHDPAGDVSQESVGRWLDIRSVSIVSQEDTLVVTMTLNNLLAAFYNAGRRGQSLGRLISLYLDSDVNRNTGGAIFSSSGRTGYDVKLDIILEAKVNEPEARTIHVPVSKIEGKRIRSLGRLVQEQIKMSAREVTIELPYGLAGLKSGDQVRICFQELAQGAGEGLSKDKLILLR